MKKFTILFIAVMLVFKAFSQTTQEEYNYITKGYAIQISSGLDMKKGYSFGILGQWEFNTNNTIVKCEFKSLMRDGQKTPCAIMMIVTYKGTWSNGNVTEYVCIPTKDAPTEIWQLTMNYVNGTNQAFLLKGLVWGLIKFCSEESKGITLVGF